MDRRDFIKKTALAAAGTAITAPVAAMLSAAGIQETDGEGTQQSSPAADEEAEQTNEKANRKMKVLLINGSPRPDGNTFGALKEIATQLEKHGVEAEIVQIGRKAVRSCIACGACHKKGECVFNDDLCNDVARKMAHSDALVVGSPVYYGQPNGGVLSLMQRLFFSSGRYVQNKPAAAVTVCRRGGATAAFQTLNMMFQMMNMYVVGSQYWNIAYGMNKGEAKLDSEGMQTMRTLANNMAWLLEKLHDGSPSAPAREDERHSMNFIR